MTYELINPETNHFVELSDTQLRRKRAAGSRSTESSDSEGSDQGGCDFGIFLDFTKEQVELDF